MTEILNASKRLKQRLKAGEATLGLWVTMESPTVSEIAAHIGLDWICIDTEHGALQLQDIANHLRAVSGSSTAALVRIQGIEQGLIQRVLGLGAHGILVPRIRTAEEVEQSVCFAKYPPRGSRGMGVERSTLWGKDISSARDANQGVLVIPMIETVQAARNVEAIMQVPDIDAVFFGPADFSASAGFVGEWEGPGIADDLVRLKNKFVARGIASGIAATDEGNGKLRIEQGFQMIALGVDCTIFLKTLSSLRHALVRPTQVSGKA